MKYLPILALFSLAVSAQAADLKATFQPIYTKFAAAEKAKDVKTIEAMSNQHFSKSLVFIHSDGHRQTGAEMLAELKANMKMVAKFHECTGTIQKIVDKGNTAEVTVANHSKLAISGPDKKVHILIDDETTLDTWAKEGGKWKLKQVKSMREKATMDGKALPGG